jgi:hypothetical protein
MRNKLKRTFQLSLSLLILESMLWCGTPVHALTDHTANVKGADSGTGTVNPFISDPKDRPPRSPVYRIPLRIHLGDSERPLQEWIAILEEINHIWLSQAGICFEMHTVYHDYVLDNGMDIWFSPGRGKILNGYFSDEHEIWVKDTPDLRPAPIPSKYAASRTAAHELGHGLNLSHREDADNNLMRSQTRGWKLNEEEIKGARKRAAEIAISDMEELHCGPVKLHAE